MALPKAFYVEPRFRTSSSDFAELRAAAELGLETPQNALALGMDYYCVEMFATERDRDLACGPTAHRDVQFYPTTRQALIRAGTSLDDISCGHPVDHPNFGDILTPIFDAALKRLIKDLVEAPVGQDGIVASTIIPIARALYKISVTSTDDWLNFDVEAISAFEQPRGNLLDRTIRYLNGRLALQLSPALKNAKCN